MKVWRRRLHVRHWTNVCINVDMTLNISIEIQRHSPHRGQREKLIKRLGHGLAVETLIVLPT